MIQNIIKYKIAKGKSKFTSFTIPENWELSSIGMIGKYINGMAFKPEQWKKSGIPIIRIQNLTDEYAEFNYFDEEFDKIYEIKNDDILISWSATLGVFRWKRGRALLNQHIFKAIPNSNIHKGFFYFAITQQVEQMKKMIHGTTMKHITKQPFLDTSIPLPPLPQQRKIASILSKVDELIQKTSLTIKQTQRLKKGVMQRLLTRGISNTKFKRIKFNSIDLDIPESWENTKMKTLSLSEDGVLTGPFGSLLHSRDYVKEGIPLILIRNIRNGKIDDKNIPKITQKDVERLARYKVKKGDIVFSRVGTVGNAALIEEKHNGWVISGLVLRIRFDNSRVNSEFVNYFIQLDLFQRILKSGIFRSSRDVINTTILENSPVLLPPIGEQSRIVDRILRIDIATEKNKKIILNLQTLRKGLMQKLLTGKIRVKV